MRILWGIHLYPPIHNCGAEYVAHNINKYLLSKGHEVRVLNLQSKEPFYNYEGVEVYGNIRSIDPFYWGDVILTHLDFTRYVINVARIAKRPVVHFVHNSSKYEEVENADRQQFVVYNSNWIAEELNYSHKSMVLYPPCPVRRYLTGKPSINNEYITLINLNENKGGLILLKLAKEMPDRKFLGVIGSYDDGGLMPQIVNELRQLPNVKVMDHGDNVKAIYAQTRILLVPSRYESWGRVATEAMINGIPVIACPTKGLIENCKGGAIFVNPRGKKTTDIYGEVLTHDGDSYDTSLTQYFIKSLDDPDEYAHYSEAAVKRSLELEDSYEKQILEFEKFLYHAKEVYNR
jgi:glycosyltransferase involved in cell wall biosynthesis